MMTVPLGEGDDSGPLVATKFGLKFAPPTILCEYQDVHGKKRTRTVRPPESPRLHVPPPARGGSSPPIHAASSPSHAYFCFNLLVLSFRQLFWLRLGAFSLSKLWASVQRLDSGAW